MTKTRDEINNDDRQRAKKLHADFVNLRGHSDIPTAFPEINRREIAGKEKQTPLSRWSLTAGAQVKSNSGGQRPSA